jgi:hypothetical protein
MSGEAPAIQQLRTDANAKWPKRNKEWDGTWGDTSHQARKSDHNTGDAIDVTNDPGSGADGNVVAAYAIRDPRVKYVIWNRRIYDTRQGGGWRPYSKWKSMPHDHHVHVSVKQAARADSSPWPWTQPGDPPPINIEGETKFEDVDPKAIAEAEAAKKKAEAAAAKKKPAPAPAKKKPVKTSEADVTGPRYIFAGEDSVLLGTKQRMAAHVQSPHTGGGKVAKGSDSVFVGTKQLAFARLGDPTTDKLNVKTGHEAILIG